MDEETTETTALDALVEKIRRSLRIKITGFDEEIKDLIEACKIDLNMAGASVIEYDDPSFIQAATLYCKAHFGYSDNAERWDVCYQEKRDSMALSREYSELQNSAEGD